MLRIKLCTLIIFISVSYMQLCAMEGQKSQEEYSSFDANQEEEYAQNWLTQALKDAEEFYATNKKTIHHSHSCPLPAISHQNQDQEVVRKLIDERTALLQNMKKRRRLEQSTEDEEQVTDESDQTERRPHSVSLNQLSGLLNTLQRKEKSEPISNSQNNIYTMNVILPNGFSTHDVISSAMSLIVRRQDGSPMECTYNFCKRNLN